MGSYTAVPLKTAGAKRAKILGTWNSEDFPFGWDSPKIIEPAIGRTRRLFQCRLRTKLGTARHWHGHWPSPLYGWGANIDAGDNGQAAAVTYSYALAMSMWLIESSVFFGLSRVDSRGLKMHCGYSEYVLEIYQWDRMCDYQVGKWFVRLSLKWNDAVGLSTRALLFTIILWNLW